MNCDIVIEKCTYKINWQKTAWIITRGASKGNCKLKTILMNCWEYIFTWTIEQNLNLKNPLESVIVIPSTRLLLKAINNRDISTREQNARVNRVEVNNRHYNLSWLHFFLFIKLNKIHFKGSLILPSGRCKFGCINFDHYICI